MTDVSTIYDKEPFERERKEQAGRDGKYFQNKKVLAQCRYYLEKADWHLRHAEGWLDEIEHDLDPTDLEDAFCALGAAEDANEELGE